MITTTQILRCVKLSRLKTARRTRCRLDYAYDAGWLASALAQALNGKLYMREEFKRFKSDRKEGAQ